MDLPTIDLLRCRLFPGQGNLLGAVITTYSGQTISLLINRSNLIIKPEDKIILEEHNGHNPLFVEGDIKVNILTVNDDHRCAQVSIPDYGDYIWVPFSSLSTVEDFSSDLSNLSNLSNLANLANLSDLPDFSNFATISDHTLSSIDTDPSLVTIEIASIPSTQRSRRQLT